MPYYTIQDWNISSRTQEKIYLTSSQLEQSVRQSLSRKIGRWLGGFYICLWIWTFQMFYLEKKGIFRPSNAYQNVMYLAMTSWTTSTWFSSCIPSLDIQHLFIYNIMAGKLLIQQICQIPSSQILRIYMELNTRQIW